MPDKTIGDVGEKALIANYIKPLFQRYGSDGIGDDCACIDSSGQQMILASTDRVPSDLISFRLGILDFQGLGAYLAAHNISDIAACGGTPRGLLLNLGLPTHMRVSDLVSLCEGAAMVASRFGCPIVGGDLSSSSELSIAATSLGTVARNRALLRSGARPGDTVFLSRPIGLTPCAFEYHLRMDPSALAPAERAKLDGQFSLDPMVELGLALSASGDCSSCMDNTDGLAQSLSEIADLSGCRIVLDAAELGVPDVVRKVAGKQGLDPLDLALAAGADISLIGTLRGAWTTDEARKAFGRDIRIVGRVEPGEGLFLEEGSERRPLKPRGWVYFDPEADSAELLTAAIPN